MHRTWSHLIDFQFCELQMYEVVEQSMDEITAEGGVSVSAVYSSVPAEFKKVK